MVEGRSSRSRPWKACIGIGFLGAMAVGVVACRGGNVTAHAVALLAPTHAASAETSHVDPSRAPGQADAAPVPASPTSSPTVGSPGGAPSPAATSQASRGATPSTAGAEPAATASATPAGAAAKAPLAASVRVPRRQPTNTEVSKAISQLHSLVPFFTPSAADVADVGNQVCTAFDQGKTFSQVKSKALDMVGAGSYSWLIPSSVPTSAIRTLVSLYCPAYSSKVA